MKKKEDNSMKTNKKKLSKVEKKQKNTKLKYK